MAEYQGQVRDAQQLGRMLQQGRLLRGLTQRQLAEELGVSQRYVHEMESGKPTKFETRLFSMMRATGVELSVRLVEETPSDG